MVRPRLDDLLARFRHRTHDRTTLDAHGLSCLLYTPRSSPRPAPLIVFLHGSGESGGSWRKLTAHSLPRLAETRRLPKVTEAGFPFIVLCPHTDGKLSPDGLRAVIRDLVQTRGADASRCYVTGISLGAIRTWWFTDAHLGRIAAIVPVSGPAPEPGHAAAGTPAWVFAGERDGNEGYRADVVKTGVEAARPDDPQLRFCVVRGGGHDAAMWNAVYSRVDVYEWLLQHRSPEPFE